MGLFDYFLHPDPNAAPTGMPRRPEQQRNEELQNRYMAERRGKGLMGALFGAADMVPGIANAGIRDFQYMTGGNQVDPYQFPYPSEYFSDKAAQGREALTGRQVVRPEQVPEDVRRSGARQELAMNFLPIGAESGLIKAGALGAGGVMKMLDEGSDTAKVLDKGASSFADWFKGSKIADEAGNPTKVYRGALGDPLLTKDGSLYFSHDPKVAANGERGFIDPADFPGLDIPASLPEGLSVTPAYLNMKNPASIDDIQRVAPNAESIRKSFPALKEAGFDGYVGKDEMAVFDPSQARSAIDPTQGIGRPQGGVLGEVADAAPKPGGVMEEARQAVSGTWGDINRPDVRFEGTSPHQFTPGQWGRFGEHYGAHNIGPADEDAWYNSLQPFTSQSGKEFHVPGGLESKEPFTYFDDLYMKAQGIDPNDLTPAQHLALHNRTVAGKQAPPGGFSDEQINNQLQLALLSPNNPLTPNEFAVAATMAKHGEDGRDLKTIAEAAPGYDYAKHPMYGPTDELHQEDGRRALSNDLLQRLGTQGSDKGGTGVSGNQDYTTLVGLAQMMREKPDFFRFKGAGEAGGSADTGKQWLNFVDRLQTQVPGLAGKTGSFGAVWQDPVKAATSAMDRHMLGTFRDKVFATPEEATAWGQKVTKKWNEKNPTKQIANIDELKGTSGGTNFFNDQIFSYVNKPEKGKLRVADRLKKDVQGPVNKPVSDRVPEHLRPENAGYVKEPTDFVSLGPAYRRGIDANVASKEASGATGVFSDQWRVWDPIRHRFEPHEITQPGLADLPRMSHAQQADALNQHGLLGYLNYAKDEADNLQPVRASQFGTGPETEGREKMRRLLKGIDPSKLAYFSMLAGVPMAGAGYASRNANRGGDGT